MIIAPVVLAAVISAGSQPAPVVLAPDMPVKIGNIEAVCTGVGLDARQNPAWASYPLKVEVAGRGGQYLGDVHLTVSQRGNPLAAVRCDGPWVLLRLAPGKYHIDAETEGQTASSAALVPADGQGRVILRFPELGGGMETPVAPNAVTPGQ